MTGVGNGGEYESLVKPKGAENRMHKPRLYGCQRAIGR
jgi:hypothetical protein